MTADPMARQKFLRGESIRVSGGYGGPDKAYRQYHPGLECPADRSSWCFGLQGNQKDGGEENRLLIFDDLEERIYDHFKNKERLERTGKRIWGAFKEKVTGSDGGTVS